MTAMAQQQRLGSPALGFVIDKTAVPQLRLRLLGGFRAERVGGRPVTGWHRRCAKTLTKLLATSPGHRLHREQVLEMLWPDVELESALNSFGKALHAARRALEPGLPPRAGSSYLRLTDSMVALNLEHVWIDVDDFEQLAERALRDREISAYEAALAAYGGELLPEDRYEDWCAERREYAAELHLRLLLSVAEELEGRGSHGEAAARLREVLHHDPTREDVHRRLMALYVSAGMRDHAVRQFQICRDVLRRELDLAPGAATQALYEELLADVPAENGAERPFVGRESLLEQLGERLSRADAGNGGIVLVSGETGVGKSRLVAEFATSARQRGCCVLWGGAGAHANHIAYGPFAVGLESYVANRSDAERAELAQRFPALVPLVPSLGIGCHRPLADRAGDDQLYLVPEIVRMLTDLAGDQSLLLVLGDLHGLHRSSLNLLDYLAPLAAERRWLIVGTYRDESLARGSALRRLIAVTERERLCLRLDVDRLARPDCDRLVRALLPRAGVAEPLLEHVYARALGNPLFVEELLREMWERDELVLTHGKWQRAPSRPTPVPAVVRSLVALRLAPLKESARRVLALVAAAGESEISLTDLRSGAEALTPSVSDAALFDGLDRALELRILEERDGSYAFRHPLVAAALYEDLSKHRRDELRAALGRSVTEPS
jgi:DNA-binding SARP family transcriptional activator